VLKSDGYGGASARAIAQRAGCTQALIFYHFGTVADLLLAALDEVSALRQVRYRDLVAAVDSPADLLEAAASIFREDLDAGYVAVLVAMIAGASSTPELGPQVAERIEPWKQFAAEVIARAFGGGALASVVPADEAAHAVVALYLGLEMLAALDGDRGSAVAVFERATSIASLLGLVRPLAAKRPGRKEQPR